MKFRSDSNRAFTLGEMLVTSAVIGVLGLIIFALLNTGTILGAKNTAVNTAHQQARVAMLQMTNNLHLSVSPLALVDLAPNPTNPPVPAANVDGPAAGILFQQWAGDGSLRKPFRINADSAIGTNQVSIQVTGTVRPQIRQRLVIPTHDVETYITAVTGTAPGTVTLTLNDPLPVAINGTGGTSNFNIVCFTTDVCCYLINNGNLEWRSPTVNPFVKVLARGISTDKPFQTPDMGEPSSPRLVGTIALSTADSSYSNRGFKSANSLLNETIPIRAKLTTAATPLPVIP